MSYYKNSSTDKNNRKRVDSYSVFEKKLIENNNFNDISLLELLELKSSIEKNGNIDQSFYKMICENIKKKEKSIINETFMIREDSATGGPVVNGGMGAVVNAQPSGIPGQTIGQSWMSNGGTVGSGDVSVPYNPSGANRVFQKISSPMGMNHGSRTGKKSRQKRLNVKTLKTLLSKKPNYDDGEKDDKPKKKNVMNFNDFVKNDLNKITRVKQ
jgi:hypothetical protein